MKRLIALISTEGKSAQQISQEAWAAYQKYQKVSQQVSQQSPQPQNQPQPKKRPSWAQELADNLNRNIREGNNPL